MPINRGYSAYHNTSIKTASPDRLLLILYDGLIQSLELSKKAIEDKNVVVAHQQLMKAQDIIREGLLGTLDMDYDISKSLKDLYEYFLRRLVTANLNKESEPVDEVLDHIRELKDTWNQAALQARQEKSEIPHADLVESYNA